MAGLYSEEDLFISFAEASPTPTALYTGKDLIIAMANPGMLAIWGKDADIIGKPLIDAVPELKGQPFIGLLKEVYTNGITYHAKEDKADLLVDGKLQPFYFNYTYKPLKNTDDQIYAIIHTAIDVTELVLARLEITKTQEQLTFALSAAGIGTWDLDPIHNKVIWNARCRELFGFPGDGMIAYQDVLSCIHPQDVASVNHAVMAAIELKNGGQYDIRYRTVSKVGQHLRWVHCKGKAYFNENGIAYRFAGTAQDITEEVKSRQREQQLLSLINQNTDHMSVADMKGNLIYMNRAGRQMLGVNADTDVTTLSAHDFYTTSELKRVQQYVINEIDTEKGWQGTIRLMNRITKEVIPCHVSYILIKDLETGEIIGRGASARDLRGEIKAKAELQRLATIVDISEDFCNYCDINGNTIYINDAGINLIGIDKNEVSSSNMFAYHSKASATAMKEVIIPELLRSGKWSGTLELLHQQSGAIIPIHKQLFIIRQDITNEPIAIAGIARDLRPEINARKAMDYKNVQLHIAIKELEFLANSVPAVVWSSTPSGKLDYINQRWYEKAPIGIGQALGNGWADTLHPDDEQRAWKAWKESLTTGNPYKIEFRLKDKQGNYRWWLVQALALTDEKGRIIKWYGTNTDINDQKELERQKDNFLGVASHELKTPVTSIKAYVQVMEKMFMKAGDDKNALLLSKMGTQVNRLNNLIEDLLDVTKINTGRLKFNDELFDFTAMVEDVIDELKHISGKHEFTTHFNFKGAISGDKERIYQVVTNLLTNAVKYSPDASSIMVYTEDHGNEVQFCVQDFGIGISRNVQDKVFEQFYRVSGTREHTFPGLGLGLYISSEIVKHLGGRIWVSSVKGKGSIFCFAVPVKKHIS
ncbi:PAS domain-containing protein [Pedobacter sp. L105]|uniref:PAS domain-containing protein n=1 Tax=Pedobacter sp. L105 TaxID=1641871 RepID=UPI00131E1DC5|nr:PAS domain-containing protein [Pedobacter sp. L105]